MWPGPEVFANLQNFFSGLAKMQNRVLSALNGRELSIKNPIKTVSNIQNCFSCPRGDLIRLPINLLQICKKTSFSLPKGNFQIPG